MLILIDGYNVIAPAAPPGRRAGNALRGSRGSAAGPVEHWLQAERMRLLQRLAEQLDPELASQTHVIFDSASGKRHGPDRLRIGGIHVRFAVSHDEADDLIEELIAAHHSPKRLAVVSSDHRLQVAARRAGAKAFDAQPWFDALLDGRVLLATAWPPSPRPSARNRDPDRQKPQQVDPGDVEQWLQAFAISADELERLPVEPPRGRRDQSARPASSVPPPPITGQGSGRGSGRGRAGGKSPPAGAASSPPPAASKRDKRRRKPSPPAPREWPPNDNPFPPGYGEDLLGDAEAD